MVGYGEMHPMGDTIDYCISSFEYIIANVDAELSDIHYHIDINK